MNYKIIYVDFRLSKKRLNSPILIFFFKLFYNNSSTQRSLTYNTNSKVYELKKLL